MANGSIRIDVDTSGASKNVQELVDRMNRLPKPLMEVSAELNELISDAKATGKSLTSASKDSQALAGALGKVATGAKSPRQELAQLKNALEESSVAYSRLSDQEKAGEFGKALKQSIDNLTQRAKSLKSSFAEVNRSLNDNKEKAEKTGGALDFLEKKLGMNISTFTKFASVGGAVAGALKVAKDAFLQNESGIDEWGRTVESAKAAYNVFLDTINGGNWSNFFSNLDQAVSGARDLYDALDRLGSIKANNQAAIAIAQAEIQKLRVLKQQGQDVDDKLKAAEARLKSLQGESIDAGKNAGRKQISETIRRRYQAEQGAAANGLTKSSLNWITNQIINRGQKFYDEQKRKYEELRKKGTVTKTELTPTMYGGVMKSTYSDFSMGALSKQDQIAYRIAKAVTEGETELQQGVTTFAAAVNEQAQAFREEFRNNRIINQKTGGSGGSGKTKTEPVFDASADTLKGMRDNISVLTKSLEGLTTGSEEYAKTLRELTYWQKRVKDQQTRDSDISNFYSGKRYGQGLRVSPDSKFKPLTPEEAKEKSRVKGDIVKFKEKTDQKKEIGEVGKIVDSISQISGALKTLGVDLGSGFENALNILNAIMTIISAIQTIQQVIESLTNGRDTAYQSYMEIMIGQMTANSYAIASNTGAEAASPFKQGGIVHAAGGIVMGRNYVDRVPATLSSGEMVLNPAQQTKLFKMANNGGGGGGNSEPYVNAETIWLGINNMGKRKGMGELVFSKRK